MYKTAFSIGLISLLCLGIVLLGVYYNTFDWPNDYAVVIDAGSSGTRAYLYEWKADFSVAKGDDLVVIQKSSCNAHDNGIDKLKSKAQFIEDIEPCILSLKAEIPENRMSRTYIFLAATAGMRLLEARDKASTDQIFGWIREYLRGTGFLFKNDSQVRILSGQEEGTDAWISANYYQDNFKNKYSGKTVETSGVLDLGGASTQIVYVPQNPNKNHSSFFSDIRIYGIDYRPYSHSFLCYGQNEINNIYLTLLLAKNKENSETPAPASCLPRDYKKNYKSSKLLESPCSSGILTSNSLPFTGDFQLKEDTLYEFEGDSNYTQCREEIQLLLPKSNCNYESCSFDNVYMPPPDMSNFMGFSGFYYSLVNTEQLLEISLKNDFDLFVSSTEKICSMTFKELQKLNLDSKANLPSKFLIKQCFSNVYVIEILSSYGINSFEKLKITDKVNDYSLNWALGYLINELNRDDFLPYEEPPRRIKLHTYLPLTVIMSVTLSFTIVVTVLYKMKKIKKRRFEQMQRTDNDDNLSVASPMLETNNV